MLASVAVFWACVAGVVVTACSPSPARAEVTLQTGVDLWSVPGGQVRYLPNYSTPNPWQNASPWVRGQGSYQLGDIALTAAGRWDAVNGGRVDRLDADVRLSASAGVRVGVLPYRVGWCRTYDPASPWMSEPDAFCRFSGLNELATGAFGAQAYQSAMLGGWLVDGMAGVYAPKVDGQVNGLGPYVKVGPDVAHSKWGASVNALHLATGIQTRAAWLRTHQVQDSTAGSYQRRIDYDTYYIAAEGSITPALDLRGSVSAYVGDQLNPANLYQWDGRSTTVELIYKPATGHSLALGLSEYVNKTTYAKAPHDQSLRVPSTSLAWRFDLPSGMYAVLQATHSKDQSTTRQGVATLRAGDAYGVRVGRNF
jgi:hypothetical protein